MMFSRVSPNLVLPAKGFEESPGFTLLEVMVAISIMAIALVAVFGSQSQSLSLANEAKFNTTAPFLAQSKMADFEAEAFEDLSSDSGDFEEDFPGYRWDLKVSDVAPDGLENVSEHLRQLDLAVLWGEDSAYEYRVRLYLFVPEAE